MSPLPNIISLSRAVAAVGLLSTQVFSAPFWGLYLWCGISDMIDGPLARRLRAESKSGAAIDSIADFVFVAIACARIIPALDIHLWIWLIVGVIAALQLLRSHSSAASIGPSVGESGTIGSSQNTSPVRETSQLVVITR